ncbi:aminoacyl tRNA synthase complex-interacting multifunctional protein 1-like isoform X3 [Glycine soja]|uniref:Putative methionine--tRNA ligase isoform B n=1 Tax=Glycine soja TaxID=3848 RepID=A0A445L3R4_GLYSO|nr:aminoacyl tRNA synthase complex-interacting multifunctional protein 1-like isoform X3 [Glycine soja]RZC17802.1 putative methionine--tRNA ligase isoform B [Glycine soja]
MATIESRRKSVALALSKYFSLDPSVVPADSSDSDIKSLYLNIIAVSGHRVNHSDEVLKWVAFAEAFPVALDACFENLKRLNDELSGKAVLLGNGLNPSEADVIVYSVVHSSLINLSDTSKEKLPHVLRWMDYIQVTKPVGAVEADLKSNKTEQSIKNVNKSEADSSKDKNKAEGKATGGKSTGDKEPTKGKAKPADKVAEKENEVSVSLLNIQVGLIHKAWKHPSADSLLVEEIDVGEAKVRQVVSGLAKYYSPDELMNRRVVLITNVKPGKLRDVMSEGLVLCASNEGPTIVEPLLPPEGAKIGEHISFSGIDGKPEDVLNPKKKQLEKITPHLFTDDKGVATYKGIPFMTSGGPCTSSIPRATIR